MWRMGTTRSEFLDLILSDPPFTSKGSVEFDALSSQSLNWPEEFQLIWRDNPKEVPSLPPIILVRKEQRREFFAWSLTYLKTLRPITAYSRVIEPEVALRLLSRDKTPFLGRLDNACLGLIL